MYMVHYIKYVYYVLCPVLSWFIEMEMFLNLNAIVIIDCTGCGYFDNFYF